MKTARETLDVLIAGAGMADHAAAIQAGRLGTRASVIEADSMLGETTTTSTFHVPKHLSARHRPGVQGIQWNLHCMVIQVEGQSTPDYRWRLPFETPGRHSHVNASMHVATTEERAFSVGVVLHCIELVSEAATAGRGWGGISLGQSMSLRRGGSLREPGPQMPSTYSACQCCRREPRHSLPINTRLRESAFSKLGGTKCRPSMRKLWPTAGFRRATAPAQTSLCSTASWIGARTTACNATSPARRSQTARRRPILRVGGPCCGNTGSSEARFPMPAGPG